MTSEWYYAHDANRIGPFSAQQLKDLAVLGNILPSDIVWKEGVEKGVQASKVKNLFSLPIGMIITAEKTTVIRLPVAENKPTEAEPQSMPATEVRLPETTVSAALPVKPALTAATAKPNPPSAKPKLKGKAVALKGADIVAQDGFQAKFRKKCTTCGHKDLSVQTLTIANKMVTTGFYCPKCKKKRDVSIQCTMR